MKKALLLLIVLLVSSNGFAQIQNIKQELVGTWEFSDMSDNTGKKIDTIKHPYGFELATGPLTTYRNDGTYTKQFTPKNADNGKWYFDNEKNAIIHLLYYSKPYSFAAQYLIDKGHAKKDQNGDYYEIVTDKIFELTSDKLTIVDSKGRKTTFLKKKE